MPPRRQLSSNRPRADTFRPDGRSGGLRSLGSYHGSLAFRAFIALPTRLLEPARLPNVRRSRSSASNELPAMSRSPCSLDDRGGGGLSLAIGINVKCSDRALKNRCTMKLVQSSPGVKQYLTLGIMSGLRRRRDGEDTDGERDRGPELRLQPPKRQSGDYSWQKSRECNGIRGPTGHFRAGSFTVLCVDERAIKIDIMGRTSHRRMSSLLHTNLTHLIPLTFRTMFR